MNAHYFVLYSSKRKRFLDVTGGLTPHLDMAKRFYTPETANEVELQKDYKDLICWRVDVSMTLDIQND